MPSNFAVALRQIPVPDELGGNVKEKRVVEAVENPREECVHSEENALLPELVELRVTIEETSRDELIEDTHRDRRRYGEKNVVQR